jgi:hypothetical protein
VHPCDMAGNRIHETLLNRENSELLIHPAVYPTLFERAALDASLVDEDRIYRSMKTSKPKSSLRRPRFPLACTARQEHRDTARSLLEPEEDMSTIHDIT